MAVYKIYEAIELANGQIFNNYTIFWIVIFGKRDKTMQNLR